MGRSRVTGGGTAAATALLMLSVLGGCAHGTSTFQPNEAEGPFRIGREDVLDISVWRDPDLSRTVPVRPDGFISLPLVGEIVAEGQTPTELSNLLKKKLSPYIQDPKVTVIVREVNSTRLFVTGEVNHPGSFPMKGRMTVLQAIALAGGFTTFANTDGILVIRPGDQGGRIAVRYSDLISPTYDRDRSDFTLRAGDTVVVP